MATRLYLGNLGFDVTSTDLEHLLSPHGNVVSAQVITDRDTGRSKGFGFAEMSDSNAAQAAIQALNGTDFRGRGLTVNEARPREERGFGGPSGGQGGGSRGGYRRF